MAPQVRRRFPDHVVDFVAGNLWELANIVEGRVPDPVHYTEMRRTTSGTDLSTGLTVHAPDQEHQWYRQTGRYTRPSTSRP